LDGNEVEYFDMQFGLASRFTNFDKGVFLFQPIYGIDNLGDYLIRFKLKDIDKHPYTTDFYSFKVRIVKPDGDPPL
jgi:hypothetical protein